MPNITALNSTSGSTNGNIIKISGTGFSDKMSNNVVKVANTPCTVKSSSFTEIVCELQPEVSGTSTLLSTNTSGSQTDGYHQGAGFKYTRHTYSGSISNYVTAARADSITTKQEDTYRSDIREGDAYGSGYCQYWRGYFTALHAGIHTFRAWSDDSFKVYIASDYGTNPGSAGMTELLSSSTVQSSASYYITDMMTSAEKGQTLEADKSYYMEVFHCNSGGSGWINTEVEVPTTTGNSFVPQVDKIALEATLLPEIQVFEMSKGASSD